HRLQRAPGKLAVADLAPARRPEASNLADRIGREVVVQQEVGPEVAVQRVDDLLVLAGAEGRDHKALRLAAGEERRAVRPRQDADFREIGRASCRERMTMSLAAVTLA